MVTVTQAIRVLIADDFKLLRDVIALHLEVADDMEVVGEAPDLEDALGDALRLGPDVIIMNDYLPPIDSAHAATRFRKAGIEAAILVISMHPEPELIRRSLGSGGNGFMHKDEIAEYVVEAVRSVHGGETYLSPRAQAAYGSTQD